METMIVESTTTAPHVVTLLWVIFVLFALGLAANIAELVKTEPPKPSSRTAKGIATAIHVGLIIWVAVVLWGNP